MSEKSRRPVGSIGVSKNFCVYVAYTSVVVEMQSLPCTCPSLTQVSVLLVSLEHFCPQLNSDAGSKEKAKESRSTESRAESFKSRLTIPSIRQWGRLAVAAQKRREQQLLWLWRMEISLLFSHQSLYLQRILAAFGEAAAAACRTFNLIICSCG